MHRIFTATAILLAACSAAQAGPQTLHYQGSVIDSLGGSVPTDTYDIRFELYGDETGGTAVWTEIDPAVQVINSLFSTILGDGVAFGDVFNQDPSLWLEVAIDMNGNQIFDADEIYSPRQPLAGAAWAIEADHLQGRQAGDFALVNHSHPGTANLPPVALLDTQPATVYLGADSTESVVLDLGMSYDPGGGPLTYAFDLTGEMVGMPGSFGAASLANLVVSNPGLYRVAGWVRDSEGAYHRDRALVIAYGFRNSVVDSIGLMGNHCSMAVITGHPAIAHFDATNRTLRYVRANDAGGASWGTPVSADSTTQQFLHLSLALVTNRPAVAYYDTDGANLLYVRASDTIGAAWGTPVTVDSAGLVGLYSSLAMVSGRPAIAYYDTTNDDLKYVRGNDSVGTTWGSPVTADSVGDVGQYASLAEVDGRPAIAYYDRGTNSNFDLKYVRANDATGATWGTALTVDSTGVVGQYASLAVVDGRPAIAYYDGTNDDLKYVRATDSTGATWGTPVVPDSTGDVGLHASLAVVDGRPAVAYRRAGTGDLKFVHANDATGASWGAPITVDSVGDVGHYASLAEIEGRAAIAYFDQTNSDQRFTILRRD